MTLGWTRMLTKNKARVEGRWKIHNQKYGIFFNIGFTNVKKNTILKQNPAYIPRKGAFFEHDLRMDLDADEKHKARVEGRWKIHNQKYGIFF